MSNTGQDLSVLRVEQYFSRSFREAMQIYRAEFPSRSQLPLSRIRALLTTGRYHLFIGRDAAQVLAMALLWVSPRPTFVHLDYLAVRQESNGQGIGTALYRWLLAHLQDLSPRAQLLTLEVESALIDFYRRSQTRVLEQVPYVFPGREGSVPMQLMVDDRRRRTTFSRSTVQALIRALYHGIHNRPAQDALLHAVLSRVPHQISLV
jgi:ribosomal protein S18 acetylase RimI-like enzyme